MQQAVHVDVEVVHPDLLQGHVGLLVVVIEEAVEAGDTHGGLLIEERGVVSVSWPPLGLARGDEDELLLTQEVRVIEVCCC